MAWNNRTCCGVSHSMGYDDKLRVSHGPCNVTYSKLCYTLQHSLKLRGLLRCRTWSLCSCPSILVDDGNLESSFECRIINSYTDTTYLKRLISQP